MPINQLVKYWKGKAVQCEVDVEEYIQIFRANVEIVRDIARENEEEQKGLQKKYYDRKATERKFGVGDFVLVFRPTEQNKLQNEWHSPFIITKQITEVTYQVDTGERRGPLHTYHINAMQCWTSPAPAVLLTLEENHDDHQSILDLEAKLGNPLSLQPSYMYHHSGQTSRRISLKLCMMIGLDPT